ncbi:MAG: Uma2 family endonuclease [Phaeodactylibacter sp.]|nr:Uma2 family endonuclease [Phaeodactylibacter sp.]
MAEKKLDTFTIEEYLTLEDQSDVKNEYEHGAITAMSGGTLNHGIIGNNINTHLSNVVQKKGTDCVTINGDVRIFIEKANSFVYPDGMMICGGIQTAESDKNSVVNPVLIVEVLSKSTESYDRGDKFHKYCSLAAFKEYVLIDQYKPVIDILYKEDSSYWKMTTTIGMDKSIYLTTLDCYIKMSDIYRNAQGLVAPQFRLDI